MRPLRTLAAGAYAARVRRQNLVVLAGATALGLWLGVGAPAVSPVAPTTIASAQVAATTPVTPAQTPVEIPVHHHGGPR